MQTYLKLRSDARTYAKNAKNIKKTTNEFVQFTKIRKYSKLVENYARASKNDDDKKSKRASNVENRRKKKQKDKPTPKINITPNTHLKHSAPFLNFTNFKNFPTSFRSRDPYATKKP